MNHKNRVFVAARKRGISVDTARRVCRLFMMKPTLSESPARKALYQTARGRHYSVSRYDPRDCDWHQARLGVHFIVKHADLLRQGGWPDCELD